MILIFPCTGQKLGASFDLGVRSRKGKTDQQVEGQAWCKEQQRGFMWSAVRTSRSFWILRPGVCGAT